MRIDLNDLDRLTGIAEALGRLFWCLMPLAFLAALLGSPGTGLLALILGAAAFVVRAGLEDFVRTRSAPPKLRLEPEVTIHRAARRPRRPKSTV
ncbi:MAG: hypothetical protein JSU06_01735 [Actinobacteria bacterium]|nr:hypothetical protein [Actinomycetota bacterium]